MISEYNLEFESKGVIGGVVADDQMKPEVVRPVQTHGVNMAVIAANGRIPSLDDTDAIICMAEGLPIGVRTADCVPIVVYAPDIRAVAAIHAGWKGSLAGIVCKTLEKLHELGADLKLAEAAFGPSICGESYEVSLELADKFRDAGFADCLLSHRHIDLEAVNTKRLVASGIPPERIHPKHHCTYHAAWLPSWRRDSTSRRLLTWICLA